jgi:hypothetical protein
MTLLFCAPQALSDFIKSVTSLPSDVTLLSLPAGPVLELVCFASQRHLTSVWLSLASMLIVQLDPPSILPSGLKAGPPAESEAIVTNALPILLQTSLACLSQPGSMESVSQTYRPPQVVIRFSLDHH